MTDGIVINFSKDFDLVLHDRLLTKISETGIDLGVVKWLKNFLSGHLQRVGIDRHLSEVRVNSGVPQGSTLGPLLFLAYVNDIRCNTKPNVWLFADCIIYRRIHDNRDAHKLQTGLNKLGEWALDSEMKINRGKSKSVSFTKARVMERIKYYFGDQLILKANSFKYLG
jgi:hypothetical protein